MSKVPFPDAISHIAAHIEAAPVGNDPFPHAVIDGVLPPDFYQALNDYWPGDSVLSPLSETGRVGRYEERRVMLFTPDFMSRLDDTHRAFWEDVQRIILSPEVIRAAVSRFAPVVQPRLAASGRAVQLYPELLVTSDRDNYSIAPHTDVESRLVSLLFYLPENDSLSALGTSLYRPHDPALESDGRGRYDFRHFSCEKTVAFLPNRLLMFPRTNRSFHGVEPISLKHGDRRLLIVNIRAPEGAV